MKSLQFTLVRPNGSVEAELVAEWAEKKDLRHRPPFFYAVNKSVLCLAEGASQRIEKLELELTKREGDWEPTAPLVVKATSPGGDEFLSEICDAFSNKADDCTMASSSTHAALPIMSHAVAASCSASVPLRVAEPGFANLGNSCYMNAVLVALLRTWACSLTEKRLRVSIDCRNMA